MHKYLHLSQKQFHGCWVNSCQRAHLANAFELEVLCTRSHLPELYLKGGACPYSPSLPPSPPAFQPLNFVEADTTYSEMRRLIICCLIKFQLVIFKIIVCISELIILYYLHVSTFIVKCSHMSEMFRGPVAGPSVL